MDPWILFSTYLLTFIAGGAVGVVIAAPMIVADERKRALEQVDGAFAAMFCYLVPREADPLRRWIHNRINGEHDKREEREEWAYKARHPNGV